MRSSCRRIWPSLVSYGIGFSLNITMNTLAAPALEQALKAFTYHKAISVRKKDGQFIGSGYIMIMYGDIAFRMQGKAPDLDSHFVSIADIDEILVSAEQ
jgi:hypothetical protein